MNVTIVRSRRKTLSLSVNRSAEVIVRAPLHIHENEINHFVRQHRNWIKRRIAEIESIKLNLENGQTVTLFGREYKIAEGKTTLSGDTIYLNPQNREYAFIFFLKALAKRQMAERTAFIAESYGFRYSGVRISSARERWGSCSRKGSISFSFRAALLPENLIEYVIVHELCHTRFFNHGEAFWREVARVLPDYEERRSILKEYGDYMSLL